MARLEFLFSDIEGEIDAVAGATAKFVAAGSYGVFRQLRDDLARIRSLPDGRSYRWGIPLQVPLCTVTSYGEYEHEARGQLPVFAKIASIWEIEPLGPYNRNSQPHRRFALAGIASTQVRIYEGSLEEQGVELAMWRAEVGDEASPGCHFHVQVLGEKDAPPFPRSLSIPRFPGLFLTPMSVFEYLLGELFQDEWKQYAMYDTSDMQHWQAIQRKRLTMLLHWKLKQVEGFPGPAWIALKTAKPPADLFL